MQLRKHETDRNFVDRHTFVHWIIYRKPIYLNRNSNIKEKEATKYKTETKYTNNIAYTKLFLYTKEREREGNKEKKTFYYTLYLKYLNETSIRIRRK